MGHVAQREKMTYGYKVLIGKPEGMQRC